MAKDKKNATKEKIILAAKKTFTSKGFDGTSVDEIAKEAGITKSLLYYYFKSKEEVFYELMKKTMENLVLKLGEERKKANLESREETFRFGINILKNELDVLRTAVSEALKTTEKTSIIFQLPALVFDEFKDEYNFTNEEKAFFCLRAINIITYLSFKDIMMENFELTSEKADEIYNRCL